MGVVRRPQTDHVTETQAFGHRRLQLIHRHILWQQRQGGGMGVIG